MAAVDSIIDPPEESDISIYVDELRSSDQNLKLNAVNRLEDIAKIAGYERTRDELLPLLTQIICESDNEDEFLIQLATHISGLKHLVGGKDYTFLLLIPLEFIATIEEPKIREAAVESILIVAESQRGLFFEEYYFMTVCRLALWENYTSKVSAAALIPLGFNVLLEEKRQKLRFLTLELSKDDVPLVRRAVAHIIRDLSITCQEDEEFMADLKEMLYSFLEDENDSVRMKALEQLPHLADKISQKERDSKMLEIILKMDPERKNWRIRYHIVDALIGMTSLLKSKVIPFYQTLVKDTEHEVRTNALNNLGNFAQIISTIFDHSDELLHSIIEIIKDLLKDQSHFVRSSLIDLLTDHREVFPDHFKKEQIPEMILSMLRDENVQVKLNVISSINSLIKYFGPEDYRARIIPELQRIATDKNWRVRNAILEQEIEAFQGWKHSSSIWPDLIELIISFRDDHVAAIRDNLIDKIISIYSPETSGLLNTQIKDLCLHWCGSTNYIFRVSVVKSLGSFAKVLDKDFFEELLVYVINKLKDERVYNVRVNIVRLFQQLYSMTNRPIKKGYTKEILARFKNETEYDIREAIEVIQAMM